MNEVFLSLGGNIGQRQQNLREALGHIQSKLGILEAISSVYETQAWGSSSQKLYLNQVVRMRSHLSPQNLLAGIAAIEQSFGRVRGNDRNADRSMDIDILFYNQEIIDTDEIQVPHPRLHLRKFVLIPLCEIDPAYHHPLFGRNIQQLLADCGDSLLVEKIDASNLRQ
jgi:2-amino-4-hydroxy-6-hydroxymethyldihydropteridine diphosphokinase